MKTKQGRPRKPVEDLKVQVSSRMDKDVVARLTKAAAADDRNFSQLLSKIAREWLAIYDQAGGDGLRGGS